MLCRAFTLILNGKKMSWFKPEVLLFMSSYSLIILLFLWGRRRALRKNNELRSTSFPEDISVVIPFRNEEENLKVLIASLNVLKKVPKELIFIDDHSDDGSIEELQNLQISYQLISLKDTEMGKKAAISRGVQAAGSSFILTWDADIRMDEAYFEELEKFEWTDLTILPVEMRGSEFVAGFFAMDYQLQTQANLALAGFFRPITASGANLLFRKSEFIEAAKWRTDEPILSGDDQFLLKYFREKKRKIGWIVAPALTVQTDAPKSMKEGLHQRFRWLGKAKKVGDSFANIFGILVFAIQMTYYSFAFYQLFNGGFGATIVMVLIKGEMDAFLSTYAFQAQFNTLQVFLYQLIYPFYMVALILFSFRQKWEWKGRRD